MATATAGLAEENILQSKLTVRKSELKNGTGSVSVSVTFDYGLTLILCFCIQREPMYISLLYIYACRCLYDLQLKGYKVVLDYCLAKGALVNQG